MSTRSSTSRECDRVLRQLKDDHAGVRKAYQRYRRLDPQTDSEEAEALVRSVVHALDAHALLEEECLYPQARDALIDADQLDEAEVEHDAMRRLIEQLQSMTADDDKFSARFVILCEYALRHAKEEEDKLFPELRMVELDWPAIGRAMDRRRAAPGADGASGATAKRSPIDVHPAQRFGRDGPGPAAYRVPAGKP